MYLKLHNGFCRVRRVSLASNVQNVTVLALNMINEFCTDNTIILILCGYVPLTLVIVLLVGVDTNTL